MTRTLSDILDRFSRDHDFEGLYHFRCRWEQRARAGWPGASHVTRAAMYTSIALHHDSLGQVSKAYDAEMRASLALVSLEALRTKKSARP